MTKPIALMDKWECFCLDCDWVKSETNNPLFHSGRKYHEETGHTVIIGKVSQWQYQNKE